MTPFLARFAEPLKQIPLCAVRYDAERQVTQVRVEGAWVDAPDAPAQAFRNTRSTKVLAETTDDV